MAVVFVLLHRYLATTVEGWDTNEHNMCDFGSKCSNDVP